MIELVKKRLKRPLVFFGDDWDGGVDRIVEMWSNSCPTAR